MHDVAPRAVKIAVAIDAIICTMNLMVSRLVMVLIFSFLNFYIEILLPRVAVKTPTRGSCILTMQRYYVPMAVNE